MKRSGETRPFRTLGTRMRDFGRRLMRHYVAPQAVPSLVEPPPPAWGGAAQTPLIWPETEAPPADFAADMPAESEMPGLLDSDLPDAQPRRVQPKAQPAQAAPPPRPPTPQKGNKADARLLAILNAHQEEEAERQRVREERKAAFDAAEIQRQADPNAPSPRRRGRLAVDYVETSALKQGEDSPPSPKPTPTSPSNVDIPQDEGAIVETPERDDEDTIPLDVHAIQAKLAEENIDWRPAPEPADTDWNAPPLIEAPGDETDAPPDWDGDEDDGGTPPRIDPPPTPLPSPGIAQRAPQSPASDFNEVPDSPVTTEADRFTNTPGTISRPSPTEDRYDPPAPSSLAQRAKQPATPDISGEEIDFRQENADGVGDVPADTASPAFEIEDSDTRPMPIQGASILPPPDFTDEVNDFESEPSAPDETGYSSLSDWVEAHTDAPGVTASSKHVQRREQPSAPDTGGEVIDFAQADQAGEEYFPGDANAPDFVVDEDDTRPMSVQRAPLPSPSYSHETLQFPASDAMTGFEPLYPQREQTDFVDAPDREADVSATAPTPDTVQRAQAYDEPLAVQDVEPFTDEAGYDVSPDESFEGEVDYGDAVRADVPPMPQTVQHRPTPPISDEGEAFEAAGAGDFPAELGYSDGTPDNPLEEQTDADSVITSDHDHRVDLSEPSISPQSAGTVQRQIEPPQIIQRQPLLSTVDDGEGFEPEDRSDFVAEIGYDEDAAVYNNETQVDDRSFEAERDYNTPSSAAGDDLSFQTPDNRNVEAEVIDDTPIYTLEEDATGYASLPEWSADASIGEPPGTVQRAMQPHTPEPGTPFPFVPPAMAGFPGDDVYETDVSALLGDSQSVQPRRAQRRAMPRPDHNQAVESEEVFDTDAPPADDSMGEPPVDLYQAMMGAGMIQPSPADDYESDHVYLPPEPAQPMSPATKADLLNLLDTAPSRPNVNRQTGAEDAVSRVYQPPEPAHSANPPPVIQRAETADEAPPEPAQDDVNVDQLARDVYSVLRNRLRIERERRDRKL